MLHFETTHTTSDLTHFHGQQILGIKVILAIKPELREKHQTPALALAPADKKRKMSGQTPASGTPAHRCSVKYDKI